MVENGDFESMTVGELVARLRELPQDAAVGYVYDGEVRGSVLHVWLARDGCVVLADANDVVYSTSSRPVDAPTEKEDRYWRTPSRD